MDFKFLGQFSTVESENHENYLESKFEPSDQFSTFKEVKYFEKALRSWFKTFRSISNREVLKIM